MNIALAIVVDPQRRKTLIAQRPPGVHLALQWEFPGGKIEEGETAAECALREAKEETSLAPIVLESWEPIAFEYPDRAVTLHPFLCEADWAAYVESRWIWVPIEQLGEYDFPAANAGLVARLQGMGIDRKARDE